jgi:putative NADPH-quinone reductase
VAEGIAGVTVVDLYAEYPMHHIDVLREQQRVEGYDVLIFQHPVYWFSAPSLVKEWVDRVVTFGWALGDSEALKGKIYLHAVTTAASHGVFAQEVTGRSALREQFHSYEAMAGLCGMRYLPPFSLFREKEGEARPDRLDRHAAAYARFLRDLRDEKLDLAQPYRQQMAAG